MPQLKRHTMDEEYINFWAKVKVASDKLLVDLRRYEHPPVNLQLIDGIAIQIIPYIGNGYSVLSGYEDMTQRSKHSSTSTDRMRRKRIRDAAARRLS